MTIDAEITLGQFELRHAEELHRLVKRNHAYLAQYLSRISGGESVETARAHIQRWRGEWAAGTAVTVGIFEREVLVGSIGFEYDQSQAELGYWLAEDAAGRGIMTRAAQAMIRYAFNDIRMHRVVIRTHTTNQRSQRVAERLLFMREGTEREANLHNGVYKDTVRYALLAQDHPEIYAKVSQ